MLVEAPIVGYIDCSAAVATLTPVVVLSMEKVGGIKRQIKLTPGFQRDQGLFISMSSLIDM